MLDLSTKNARQTTHWIIKEYDNENLNLFPMERCIFMDEYLGHIRGRQLLKNSCKLTAPRDSNAQFWKDKKIVSIADIFPQKSVRYKKRHARL